MDDLSADPLAVAILLAAAAAADTEARAAALGPALRARVDQTLAALGPKGERDRGPMLRSLAAAVAPRVGDAIEGGPPRARAIVAALTTRERGARWLREAPPPRVGFRATGALRTTLAATEASAWRA